MLESNPKPQAYKISAHYGAVAPGPPNILYRLDRVHCEAKGLCVSHSGVCGRDTLFGFALRSLPYEFLNIEHRLDLFHVSAWEHLV